MPLKNDIFGLQETKLSAVNCIYMHYVYCVQ